MKINELKKGLIVSCQATAEEPMRDSAIIGRFALAAEMGGAVGVRVNGVADILAAKQLITIPVLGIIKHDYPGYWSYITPTLRDVEVVYNTGAEMVAVDVSSMPKPGGLDAKTLIKEIKRNFPEIVLMGDISTLDEGLQAEQAGVDLISTTLAGYTPHTKDKNSNEIMELRPPDVELVEQLVQRVKVPVVAEGRYWDEGNAIKAFEAGAHNVVIGAGITRPQVITKKIVDNITPYCN
ncbi:MAG: N-acetylmannosamine-6-phosphate 2-epimerase [Oscillospiraceae bacterium]|nr:N-acetylmannosamine-6-phosphate 2-epimerase [Oscillospiraceae bacterium]